MKKILLSFVVLLSTQTFATIRVPSNECVEIVKAEVMKKMESPDFFGSPCKCGLNKIKPNFTQINTGGVYIHYAYVENSFNWKVVTVVNKNCEIISVNIPSLK